MWQLLCLLLSEIKNMLPIKLQLSPCISKQMFGSHEYMGVNTKSNVFMLQCTVHAELLSSLWSNYILNGVTDVVCPVSIFSVRLEACLCACVWDEAPVGRSLPPAPPPLPVRSRHVTGQPRYVPP